jgi:HEAT repeat protein
MKKVGILLGMLALAAAAGYGWYHYNRTQGNQIGKGRARNATPQDCIAAMNVAGQRKDFDLYLSCVSPAVQNQQIGWLAFQLQREAAINRKKWGEIAELLERHNLKGIDVMELLQIRDMPRGKGAAYALDLVGSRVTNKAAFLAEAEKIISAGSKPTGPTGPTETPLLVDVKIEGDIASAKVKSKKGADLPIWFRRIDGSWVLADEQELRPQGRDTGLDAQWDSSQKQPSKLSREEEEVRARRMAAETLGKSGPKAVPALIDMLKDENSGVRMSAAYALGQIGPDAKAALPALMRLLEDKSSEARGSAAEAVARIAPAEKTTIPALTHLLRDDDLSVRRPAAFALARIGQAAVPVLAELLKDKDARVRLEAAEALRAMGAKARPAIPALAEALRDDDAEVRRAAYWALCNTGPPAISPLTKLLKDKNVNARSFAASALGAIFGEWPDARTDPAAKAAVAALIALLKDNSPEARGNAAGALGRIGPAAEAAIPSLVELLKDKENRVRGSAAEALGLIGTDSRPILLSIADLLGDPDVEVRRSACLAFQRLGQPAIAVLAELLNNKDQELRCGVAWTLGEIGPGAKNVVPKLKELLKDKEANVRQSAAQALDKIGSSRNSRRY